MWLYLGIKQVTWAADLKLYEDDPFGALKVHIIVERHNYNQYMYVKSQMHKLMP